MNAINTLGSYISWAFSEEKTASNGENTKPMSDSDIRKSYNEAVSKEYNSFLKKAAEFHDNEQCFGEDLAREAYGTRNKIKEAHQEKTSTLGRVGIWIRNQIMYGSGNANYEGLSKKKNPEEIAYSAFKTDGSDLGLKGNDLGDVLNTWHAIKDVTTLYPENITPEMVAAHKAQDPKNVDVNAILAAGNIVPTQALFNSDTCSARNNRNYI